MIALDEHLNGLEVERAIRQWYRGRVCSVMELRPGSVIKDDAIPHLLRGEREPTFVTLNCGALPSTFMSARFPSPSWEKASLRMWSMRSERLRSLATVKSHAR